MPIPFTCPHCGKQTDVAEEYAGRSGPCAACGITATVPGIGAEAASIPPRKSNRVLVDMLSGAAVLVVALPCLLGLLSAIISAWNTAGRFGCMRNLQSIGLAMKNYESRYGGLPPAYTTDKQGRPLLSWRVVLLPYMDHLELYKRFHLDEPWDSPNNLPLAQMPIFFRCSSRPDMQPGFTPYMVIVGPHTAFPGKEGIRLAEISDGLENTILFVEAQGLGVPWTAPQDLNADTMSYVVNSKSGTCIGGHRGGGNVALCDGNARFFPSTADPEMVRRAVMCDDGLPIDATLFPQVTWTIVRWKL